MIATKDVVGERMAGPGIRAWHLAIELAKHFPTTLIGQLDDQPREVPTLPWNSHEARSAMRDAAVLIGQPARGFRKRRPEQRIVYDLFDPVLRVCVMAQEMDG